MHRSLGWLGSLLGLSLGALLSVTCGPPVPPGGDCRYNPHCVPVGGLGGLGAYCNHNADCGSGHCCEKNECDGGMCTYECKGDPDCPAGTLCEHGVCLYACAGEADCAPEQKCEHRGVCEW